MFLLGYKVHFQVSYKDHKVYFILYLIFKRVNKQQVKNRKQKSP